MRAGSILVVALALLLGGCAAALVASTSDPWQKLDDAVVLFEQRGRPLPAEKLVRESIEIFETQKDPHGLANSYVTYGELLSSRVVASREKVYRRDGFYDRSLTFDARLAKAEEYFRKALPLFDEAEKRYLKSGTYDRLSNAYFREANALLYLKQKPAACDSLVKAKEAARTNIARNPDARQNLPSGTKSFAEFIDRYRNSVGCS